MNTNHKTFERICRHFKKELEIVPYAKLFKLFSSDVDDQRYVIDRVKVELGSDGRLDTDTESVRCATVLWERAEDVCKANNSPTRFIITSYAKEEEEEGVLSAIPKKIRPRSNLPFLLRSMSRDPGMEMVGETEPATEKGLAGMLMRHNEAKDRFMMSLVMSCTEGVMRENERLSRRVEKNDETRMKQMELMEELMSEKLERDITQATALDAIERKKLLTKKAIDEVMPMLPMLIEGVLKKMGFDGPKKALPPSSTPPNKAKKESPLTEDAEEIEKLREFRKNTKELLASMPEEIRDQIMEKMGSPENLRRLTSLYEAEL